MAGPQCGSSWSSSWYCSRTIAQQLPLGVTTYSIWLENRDHPPGQLARFVVKAVVEERLAAAGLRLGEGDLAAEPLEDLGDGDPDVRIELVRQAGDKQRTSWPMRVQKLYGPVEANTSDGLICNLQFAICNLQFFPRSH